MRERGGSALRLSIRQVSLLLPLLTLVAGCSSETGVVVAVTTTTALDELRFYVGLRQRGDSAGKFILDKAVSGMKVAVTGRSLAARPYELFLDGPGGAPSELAVLVLGVRRRNGNTEVPLFAYTERPQKVEEGEVFRRTLALSGWSNTRRYEAKGSCRIYKNSGETFRLYPVDDLDCDGSGTRDTPPDCNDADDTVRPGYFEYCDGKDNACDGNPPASVGCYALQGEDTCYYGSRGCAEATGGAVTGECAVSGEPVPMAYCAKYDACTAPDPLRCARTQVNIARFACTLKMKPDGTPCASGTYAVGQPASADTCRWAVVRAGGYNATFELETTTGVQSIAACKPTLRISVPRGAASGGTVVAEFFANEQAGYVREFSVALQLADSCDKPWVCTEAN